MPNANTERLRGIKTLSSLVVYLRDELDWPIEAGDADDITFDYAPSELGIDEKSAVRIKEIKQLRPLTGNQPWGIFFVNFEKKRLPVVIMRLILRALVFKKRASANHAERQAWKPNDLLFISAYGEDTDRAITFAHFVENPGNNLAELRVLGWDDDDTPLHMDYVAQILHDKLRWDAKLSSNPDAWRARWTDAFLLRHRFVITKSDELAEALAVLACRLRARIRTVLRSEDGFGEIRKLQRAFQSGLIHDLNDDGFADMFAQTVTYGLFSVSVRRTFPGEGTAVTKDDVPNLIFTSPFLKDMLGTFLGLKSRKGKIDFDGLGVSDVTDLLTSPDTHMEVVLADFNNKNRGEDPVIHFYEDFLNSYNKELKVQRGVFYTPQPVVSYIVRSVHRERDEKRAVPARGDAVRHLLLTVAGADGQRVQPRVLEELRVPRLQPLGVDAGVHADNLLIPIRGDGRVNRAGILIAVVHLSSDRNLFPLNREGGTRGTGGGGGVGGHIAARRDDKGTLEVELLRGEGVGGQGT